MADELGIASATRDSITIAKTPVQNAKTLHVYSDVDKLEGTEKVGTMQCAALIQYYSSAPKTMFWEEGEMVVGNTTIVKGTPVATFVDGKYLSNKTGNHAAYFLSQDDNGITIMEQFANDEKKPKVSARTLRKKGKKTDGSFNDPSNNADAYSIILW